MNEKQKARFEQFKKDKKLQRLANKKRQTPQDVRERLDNLDSKTAYQIFQYLMREKSKKSLWTLATQCLGMKFLSEKVQKPLCEFVQNEEIKRKLILWPRFHGKTKICTVAKTIHILINNPDARILILSATASIARDFLAEIKGHFTNNQIFRAAFPELCPADTREFGTQDYFDVPCKKEISKEHSVTAASIETNLTGMHYTHVIKDDLVVLNNSTTKELCQKTIEQNQLTYSLMEPTSSETIVGTRYSYADAYGHIVDNMKDFYQISKESVFRDGKPLLDEYFGMDKIEEWKRLSGAYTFSCQFENEPIDPETAIFHIDHVKTIDSEMLPNLYTFTTVDPAISDSATADYTAIVTVGVDAKWNMYVLDIFRSRVKPDEIINAIIDIYARFKPIRIGIESVAFQKSLIHFFRERCKNLNLNIAVEELKRDTKVTKYQRISAIQPKLEYGELYITKDCRNKEHLLDEMKRFPKCAHDDCVDALADILRIGFKPETYATPNRIEYGSGQYWENVLNYMESNQDDHIGNQSLDPSKINLVEAMTYVA